MAPVPLMVWSPCGARMLFWPILTVPLSTKPPATRSMPVAEARSSTPLKFTLLKMLLPLLLARKDPAPPLVSMVPLSATPFCSTVLPAPATIWLPTPPKMLLLSTSVPPFWADKVPLLVTAPLTASVIVPPLTSALMVPLLVSVAAPPTKFCAPMMPVLPRTVMPLPRVRSPASRFKRLLALASAKAMLPVPAMVWVPCDAKMLLLPILIVPLSVMPPAESRSMPVPHMSSAPLSVTPFRKLLPLLKATSAPVPVELMVPPEIEPPNWLTTLPLAMLITPPVLVMSWPAETPRLAVMAPPTLTVPVLVVLPPPTRLSPNASMLICPALLRLSTDCPVLIVTTPTAPMPAVSTLPGVPAGLPLPATHAAQLASAAQLPAVVFQVQLAADAGMAAPSSMPPTNNCATSCAMVRTTTREG